jgi:hypothetical protein
MGRLRLVSALALAFVPSIGARAGAEENVPDLLRRQTLELIDAITTGSPAV